MSETVQDAATEGTKSKSLPEWLVGIATPAIVIGGATAYFSGIEYHDAFLGKYGLEGAAIQWSIQQTIAYGYYALLRSLFPTTVLGVIMMMVVYAVRGSNLVESRKRTFLGKHRRVWSVIQAIYATGFFAGLGYFSGNGVAEVNYRNIENRISNKCSTCFLYRTERGQVVGIIIGQDEKTTVIVTRQGAVTLPTGSLKAIRAINRQRPAARWAVL